MINTFSVILGFFSELKLKAPHSTTLSTLSLIQDACKCSNFNFYLNYTFKCKDAYIIFSY